jgi:hypothetical protein
MSSVQASDPWKEEASKAGHVKKLPDVLSSILEKEIKLFLEFLQTSPTSPNDLRKRITREDNLRFPFYSSIVTLRLGELHPMLNVFLR